MKKILLDTNILIHRERPTIVRDDIGELFFWIDHLKYEKYLHPITIEEIRGHKDKKHRESMMVKIASYKALPENAPINPDIKRVCGKMDDPKNKNALNDTILLNELAIGRVDIFITEDKTIHEKARLLGLNRKVFFIENFIETMVRENPGLIQYKMTTFTRKKFCEINLQDTFFDSFRQDYQEFDKWFEKKYDNEAYVYSLDGNMRAFLYIKEEDASENYDDITPSFPRKKRLKIGTLKVDLNGYKIGERFIKVIFDHAVIFKVDEIYVTIFDKDVGQKRLIEMLAHWGFKEWGKKSSSSGEEKVYIRSMSKISDENPKISYPRIDISKGKFFITPIQPRFHTELFPDSIVKGEQASKYDPLKPHRTAICKIFVSRSINRSLKKGDTVLFYRTCPIEFGAGHRSVITTVGIVEEVIDNIKTIEDFLYSCRDRTAFTRQELSDYWNRSNIYSRPFIVKFIYLYSFPEKPNLNKLIENGIIKSMKDVPRGFMPITKEQMQKVLTITNTNESLIIN